jgi:hypothetical protein
MIYRLLGLKRVGGPTGDSHVLPRLPLLSHGHMGSTGRTRLLRGPRPQQQHLRARADSADGWTLLAASD